MTEQSVMPREAAADRLRDVVMLTSYEKSTRLDVPVFRAEHAAHTVPVDEVALRALRLPPARPCAQPAFAAVGRAVARAMLGDVRAEPLNTVLVHRAYPSPRGLFPVELDFVFDADGERARLRYDAEHHALLLPAALPAALTRPARLQLDLVAALDRIASLYGELAPTLCVLEAGHAAYQLCLALREAGLRFRLECAGSPSDEIGGGELPARPGFVAASIVLDGVLVEPMDIASAAETVRAAVPRLDAEGERRARHAAGALQAPPLPPRQLSDIPLASDTLAAQPHGVLRSSGNTLAGIGGEPVPPPQVDRLCADLANAFVAMRGDDAAWPVELTLLRSHPNLDVTVTRAGRDVPETRVAAGCIPLGEAYGTLYNIDLQTIPVVAVLSAPFGALLARGSSWAYVQTLLFAGALAQGMGNVAARHGFFARPFKGMIEAVLEPAFDIEGQAFYTLLLGRGGPANPALSLEPMW